MAEIPLSVLSEHFQEKVNGRRLLSAVFLTFRLEPGFFEEEVIPAFLNISLSHAPRIKLLQVDEALRSVRHGIAVYYDQDGLLAGAGAARLDIRRIPVRHSTGKFHAKNVLALLEEREPDDEGRRARSLLAACLSANLTRAGWWENVEVCHTEEIREGDSSRFRDDLAGFLERLAQRTLERSPGCDEPLRAILRFLRATEQRSQRSSGGRLHTSFHDGRASLPDFLEEAGGSSLRDMNLELISPYFDRRPESAPLGALLERFSPREVRILLPRGASGEVSCTPELFEWVRQHGVTWARLPPDILSRGKAEEVLRRFVHAKVYRFFSQRPRREVLLVGSPNLTASAHQRGGNLETGFLVDVPPRGRPDWWLEPETRRPSGFQPIEEDGSIARNDGTRLTLRFCWVNRAARAFWDGSTASPAMKIVARGVMVLDLSPLHPRQWTDLSGEASEKLQSVLASTSLLTVQTEGIEDAWILVEEEGMSHRPATRFELSPADILWFWSLLTEEQRASFIDARASRAELDHDAAALVTRHASPAPGDSLFDQFAGIFHGFGCLERCILRSLDEGNERDATYRLFGEKYDSLRSLLGGVARKDAVRERDSIEEYIIFLCAGQLVRQVEREREKFWTEHDADARLLREQLGGVQAIRDRLIAKDPAEMPAFLEWFERWFLKRAVPVERDEAP